MLLPTLLVDPVGGIGWPLSIVLWLLLKRAQPSGRAAGALWFAEDPEVGKQILLRLLAPFHDKVKGIVQGMPAAKIVLHNDYLCVDPAEAKWSRCDADAWAEGAYARPAYRNGCRGRHSQ